MNKSSQAASHLEEREARRRQGAGQRWRQSGIRNLKRAEAPDSAFSRRCKLHDTVVYGSCGTVGAFPLHVFRKL